MNTDFPQKEISYQPYVYLVIFANCPLIRHLHLQTMEAHRRQHLPYLKAHE